MARWLSRGWHSRTPCGAADGQLIPYAIPEDLYVLAAMNQADASVEPLDVAFLRRWDSFVLEPDEAILRLRFGLDGSKALAGALPDTPNDPKQILEASVRAWKKINRRISLGRGPEFQVGHGVLMQGFGVPRRRRELHRSRLGQGPNACSRGLLWRYSWDSSNAERN